MSVLGGSWVLSQEWAACWGEMLSPSGANAVLVLPVIVGHLNDCVL